MTRFVATQLAHDHWFSSLAAEKDLGYRPLIGMEEAMRKTLPLVKNPLSLSESAPCATVGFVKQTRDTYI